MLSYSSGWRPCMLAYPATRLSPRKALIPVIGGEGDERQKAMDYILPKMIIAVSLQ